ncbi:MAG: undecaprenyl/decaprenyl-phosphate alpha-N-acetylglucosaminyl 1-phosphate transferase [Fimbriimonadales bacterium]|nr:undecaprenyl/decaprenyl-phosphate alpha-N-acetylglucosaminyl 1-phosphate transferase [Fimbriimonadales bacterium]
MKTITVVFILALLTTYLLTPHVRRWAIRCGVMDLPDARRVHTEPIPRWGGIAIYAGVVVGMLAGLFRLYLLSPSDAVFLSRAAQFIGLLLVGTGVLLVGMIDDKRPLSAWVQMGVLLLAGLIVQLFGVQIEGISVPLGGKFDQARWMPLGIWAVPITAFWMFVISKTMDTIDGLDGLAAGVSAIAAFALALMALQAADLLDQPYPNWLIAITAAAIAGAAGGFLRYNFNPARIFMGTGGAQFLGFMLGGLSVIGAFKTATAFAIFIPILVFGLPLLDAGLAVVRRALAGQPIHMPDKKHIHHQLLERGLTQRQTVLLLYGVAVVMAVMAIWLFRRALG